MRKAGLLVWQAHQIAAPMIRPGVTTGEIEAAMAAFFREQDATPLFLKYPNPQKGKRPFPAVSCMSINEAVVHGIPGDRVLEEGDILSIDTGCRVDGWCGDAAVTHPVGQVAPEVQKLLDVTREVLNMAIKLMSVKTRWSQVARPMAAFVRQAGFSSVEDFVGHGIGRDMHESPQVPNYVSSQLTGRHDFQLKTGLVIAVEPMVNMGTKKVRMMRDEWTMSTKDRKPSAHFEHTVALTTSGPRILTAPPQPDEEEWVNWGRQRLRAPEQLQSAVAW